MSEKRIQLNESERRGLSAIVLDPDIGRFAKYEALWDSDPDLSRSTVMTAASISEARRLVKREQNSIAIVVDSFDNLPLPNLILELRSSNKNIEIVGVMDAASIPRIRECNAVGPLLDLTSSASIATFEDAKSLLLNSFRVYQNRLDSKFSHSAAVCESVCRAVLATDESLASTKEISARLIRKVLPKFDFDRKTALAVIYAERAYFPHIKTDSYPNILAAAAPEIIDFLRNCGNSTSAPTSAPSLIITAANVIASMASKQKNLEEIRTSVQSLPLNLKHRAIRAFDDEVLSEAVGIATSVSKAS